MISNIQASNLSEAQGFIFIMKSLIAMGSGKGCSEGVTSDSPITPKVLFKTAFKQAAFV
jgi:hypothetical protein